MKSGMRRFALLATLALHLVACGPQAPKTPLTEAVRKGDTRTVQQHLAARTDVNLIDRSGWAPLHVAVLKGDLAMVKLLGSAGADVQQPGLKGKTPLDLARENNHPAILQFLQQQPERRANTGRGLVDGGLGVSGVLDSQ